MFVKSFKEFINENIEKTNQINLDEIDQLFDYELFDNGDTNYYFTTDKPSPNNDDTMAQFLDMVEESDDSITWEVDGSQAFAERPDGTKIQLDAGGDGDFTHHLVMVTVIK